MTDREEAAARSVAIWPYFVGPCWFGFVWAVDDFLGALLSCVGMLFALLFCLYEVGRIADRKDGHE